MTTPHLDIPGYPMIADHHPRLLAIAGNLAATYGRSAGDHEFQTRHGVRRDEQRRLAARGATMRVYVPYGHDWYGYFMLPLAERPADVRVFLPCHLVVTAALGVQRSRPGFSPGSAAPGRRRRN